MGKEKHGDKNALLRGDTGQGKDKNKGAKSNENAKDAKTEKKICWAFHEAQCFPWCHSAVRMQSLIGGC